MVWKTEEYLPPVDFSTITNVHEQIPIWICDALLDLVPFVQFKRREKHPWRSVNFSKVAG